MDITMDIDENKLISILTDFPAILDDRIKFVGILKDYFPVQKLSCNVIIMAYDLDIVKEIRDNDLNEYFIARFAKKMVNEYGIQSQVAQDAVVLWCETYGKSILKKDFSYGVDNASNVGQVAKEKSSDNETEQRNIHEGGQQQTENVTGDLLSIGDYKDIGDGYITFGTYPQSVKEENIQVGKLYDNERGYYLGSDGCLYEKYLEKYYKVEPIKWKILLDGNDQFVVANDILDQHRYDRISNNYAKSEMREYLNGEFYEKAFNDTQKSQILITLVDNSSSSFGVSAEYASRNTKDKVFLLSRKEVEKFLFYNKECQKKGSDYAKARGLFVNKNLKHSSWWLRSPYWNLSYAVQDIRNTGSIMWSYSYDDNSGVVPALRIKNDLINIADFDIQNGVLVKYSGKKTEVVIPESVKGIGDSAFSNCTGIKKITIPDGVTSIGQFAFYNCGLLSRIIIPKSVKFIGNSAFLGCVNLRDIFCRSFGLFGLPKGWDQNWLGLGFDRCKAKVIWGYLGD